MTSNQALLSAVLAFGVFCDAAEAADIWGPGGFSGFCSGLESLKAGAVPQDLGQVMKRRGMDLKSVHRAGFEDIDPVLERVARQGLATLDTFTDPGMVAGGGCALLLDRQTLVKIDGKYDLHSVWLISGARDDHGHAGINMNYLMAGNGILALAYDGEMDVSVDDGSGEQHSYRYMPQIVADIVNSGSRRGLFNVHALARGQLQSFQGPYGAAIRSFEVSGGSVRVSYDWAGEHETVTIKVPVEFRPSQRVETEPSKQPL